MNCKKCNDTHYLNVEIEGIIHKKKCECFKKEIDEKMLVYKMHEAGLTDKEIEYDISMYKGEKSLDTIESIKKFVDVFEEKGKNIHLFMYGNASCQKTTVSKWMIKELVKKGISCKYILMNNLLNDVIIGSKFAENKEDALFNFNSYLKCDFLVVDESFAKDRVTIYKSGYQISYIDQFLRERLETLKKSTLFISNYTIESIQSQGFNSYIQEIIFRNCHVLEFKDMYRRDLIKNNLSSIL